MVGLFILDFSIELVVNRLIYYFKKLGYLESCKLKYLQLTHFAFITKFMFYMRSVSRWKNSFIFKSVHLSLTYFIYYNRTLFLFVNFKPLFALNSFFISYIRLIFV